MAVDDNEFSDQLVSRLREVGYIVVEPEVADYKITQIKHPSPSIRVSSMSRDGNARLSQVLPLPVTTRDVLAALLRMLITRKRSSPGVEHLSLGNQRVT